MTSEYFINLKDALKLNILKELLTQQIEISLILDSRPPQDYTTKIHSDSSRVSVFGKFNLSEDTTGETLSIRPVTFENKLKIIFTPTKSLTNKTISIYRGASKQIETTFDITPELIALELIPINNIKYRLLLHYQDSQLSTTTEFDPELMSIETQIADIQQKQNDLFKQKKTALKKLKTIEAEYQKNFDAMQTELELLKSQMTADASILEYYKDKDIAPVETLIADIKNKIEEMENQIRLFITAKQQKMMDIEAEIKSNKPS